MSEHSIIYREPGACWSGHVRRHRRDINSGHVYSLWPFTNITAQIRVLNAKYDGPPSASISFVTAEGGTSAIYIDTSATCHRGVNNQQRLRQTDRQTERRCLQLVLQTVDADDSSTSSVDNVTIGFTQQQTRLIVISCYSFCYSHSHHHHHHHHQ